MQPLVKFKSHLYYEDKDKVPDALTTVPGSKIILFKNGESQGVAFENINGGAYYPAISIYKNATVSVNFFQACRNRKAIQMQRSKLGSLMNKSIHGIKIQLNIH